MTYAIPIPMPNLAPEKAKALMLQLLARDHTGMAKGIGATALARKCCTSERMLRVLISEAREEGTAIVGTPATGYYIAQTSLEVEDCCRFLHARALKSLHIEAQLRRMPLADLLGQLHLPT